MTRNLVNRVRKLEEKKAIFAIAPQEMTKEELIWVIRDGLKNDFNVGKNKDLEKKIREYEAQGKTLSDIEDEEPEWYWGVIERLAN